MSRQHLNRACKKKSKYSKAPKRDKTFKSNFDKVVKNIALKSQKSKYNPEIDMNWCNLPMEMRLECVKRLDFKTRFRFRRTSKAEKSLVDAKKHQFEHLKIVRSGSRWHLTAGNYSEIRNQINSVKIGSPDYRRISAILKHAEVKNFCLSASDCPHFLKTLAKFAPFGFKRVSVKCITFIPFFMKHCPNLEKVDFCANFMHISIKEIPEAPSLMNIKEFKFMKVFSEDFIEFLEELVQKWIDNNAGIGKSIQFLKQTGPWSPVDGAISVLAQKFTDRIIGKTEKEIRIRMNNNTTQILFRQVGIYHEEHPRFNHVSEYCSCKVIPIDMPKSEYENGDRWIQVIYEKNLVRNDELEKAVEFDTEDQKIWGEGNY